MSSLSTRLGRGVAGQGVASGGTISTASPPASDRSSLGAYGEFKSGIGDVTRGRVSLLMLNSLVLAAVVFYIWTRGMQGTR